VTVRQAGPHPACAECAECGAPLATGRGCRDYFHDLLALESRVPGGPGAEPHFFAVASYNLQHPGDFVPSVLTGLRDTLADVLAGRATLDDARMRARRATNGATRVRRRADTALSDAERAIVETWPVRWAMTVRDVVDVPPADYAARVRAWATAVVAELGAARAPTVSAPARAER
jgi:hypothetical protein